MKTHSFCLIFLFINISTNIFSQEINCPEAKSKYLEMYPDVANANFDAWSHFINHGKKEGRIWPDCNIVNKQNTDNSKNQTTTIFGNYEYFILNSKISWIEAKEYCKNKDNQWFIPNRNQIFKLADYLILPKDKIFWIPEEGISDPSITDGYGLYIYDVAKAFDVNDKQLITLYKSKPADLIILRSLGNNYEKVKSNLHNAYPIEEILVSKEEFKQVSYKDAFKLCNRLGVGWRIPTIEELEKILSKGIKTTSDLDRHEYLSSTRSCDNCLDSYYSYDLKTSKKINTDDKTLLRVIPVYSKPKVSIQTWNFGTYEIIPNYFGPMTLEEANAYCIKITEYPNKQWRITNLNELSSMLQYKNEISSIVGKTFMSYTPSNDKNLLKIIDIAPLNEKESYWMSGNKENKYYFFIAR
jgi:hypothetical protein